ncbi:hypothetical protein D9758_011097 [Tetrapyrgos nigripes]|uniref:Fe2OG dioxygenase domain-containing protein n=1 Tax=Tetrapyrgos nigripes TaxID=182062 RepID=A0A8H5CSU1_9AGAR|nr:hypothetical protein D9758_011097 [Tetrapyrgos nigripes]
MPSVVNDPKPQVDPWIKPAPTNASLDWAPLQIIDLSKYDLPGGKEELVKELQDSVRHWGFWTIVGSGISQEQIDRQLSIANTFFKLPLEEKRKVRADVSVGNNFGYREPTRFVKNTDVKENMETLNVPKYTPDYNSVPRHDLIKAFEDEIAPFHRLLWTVVRKLFVLLAIILELPEDYLVERHQYDEPSEDHIRFLMYHARSASENKKIGDQWLGGHTDFGSLTLLFSQPVAALQIRSPDNEWKWVKYIPGGITCNAGDTLSFLTKGYIKSTIHRVVSPPADQANLDRLGLIYFSRPGNSVPMIPAPSPVLIKEGYITGEDEKQLPEDAVTAFEYVRARVKHVLEGKATRDAQRSPDAVFQVSYLKVQDYYV